MRDIIFRGKRNYNGEWLEGSLIISNLGKPYIYPKEIIEQDGHHIRFDDDGSFFVDPETVGQFTGILDKNGVKIFENDIIKNTYANNHIEHIGMVLWHEKACGWGMGIKGFAIRMSKHKNNKYEVMGNIFDNLELLMEAK